MAEPLIPNMACRYQRAMYNILPMKILFFLLTAATLSLVGCATPGQDMGKIGSDYQGTTSNAVQAQSMHTNIQRGNF
jgi:hypothetical protein